MQLAKQCRVIAVLGTRPEAIKLSLVIRDLRYRSAEFEMVVVHTGQHDATLDHFEIKPDFDLDVMRPDQTLSLLTCRVIDTVENVCHRLKPDIVLVQGDTTTLLARLSRPTIARFPWATLRRGFAVTIFTTHSQRRQTAASLL